MNYVLSVHNSAKKEKNSSTSSFIFKSFWRADNWIDGSEMSIKLPISIDSWKKSCRAHALGEILMNTKCEVD